MKQDEQLCHQRLKEVEQLLIIIFENHPDPGLAQRQFHHQGAIGLFSLGSRGVTRMVPILKETKGDLVP